MAEDYVPVDLADQVENFKEKTGLSDADLRKIVEGGEYQARKELLEEGKLKDEMRMRYDTFPEDNTLHFTPQEYINDSLRDALTIIISDETITLMEELESETGLSTQQAAKILDGASELTQSVLKGMMQEVDFLKEKVYEVESLKTLPIDQDRFTETLTQNLEAFVKSTVIDQGMGEEFEVASVQEGLGYVIGNAIHDLLPESSKEQDISDTQEAFTIVDKREKKDNVISFQDKLKNQRSSDPDKDKSR